MVVLEPITIVCWGTTCMCCTNMLLYCSITTCQRFIHILKASSNDSLQTFTTGISFHACGWSIGSGRWGRQPACDKYGNLAVLYVRKTILFCAWKRVHMDVFYYLTFFLQLLDFTWTCHAVITKSVLILSHQFRLQPPAPVGSVPRQCSFVFLMFRLTFIYLTYVYFISFFIIIQFHRRLSFILLCVVPLYLMFYIRHQQSDTGQQGSWHCGPSWISSSASLNVTNTCIQGNRTWVTSQMWPERWLDTGTPSIRWGMQWMILLGKAAMMWVWREPLKETSSLLVPGWNHIIAAPSGCYCNHLQTQWLLHSCSPQLAIKDYQNPNSSQYGASASIS